MNDFTKKELDMIIDILAFHNDNCAKHNSKKYLLEQFKLLQKVGNMAEDWKPERKRTRDLWDNL